MVGAYEAKVENLERRKAVLEEKVAKCGRPARDYDATFQTALQFLSSPWNLWSSGQHHLRKIVLRLAFSGRISYQRDKGLRTAQVSEPFRLFELFKLNWKMVELSGIEPLTSCMPCKRSPD